MAPRVLSSSREDHEETSHTYFTLESAGHVRLFVEYSPKWIRFSADEETFANVAGGFRCRGTLVDQLDHAASDNPRKRYSSNVDTSFMAWLSGAILIIY